MTTGTANLSSGTVAYTFASTPGFVIQHASLFQKTTLYTSGNIRGDYSTNGGATFKMFYRSPAYPGSPFTYERFGNLRNVLTTNLIVRYDITLTNGMNFNVQFLRDCDDAATALTVDGTVIARQDAARIVGLVPPGAVWKYLDTGTNLGTLWRNSVFDDSAWPSGAAEFGYGDGDEATKIGFGPASANKFVTTYFRTTFQWSNAVTLESLRLGLLRDDGAVVYLNGNKIFESNMANTIDYQTYALVSIGDPNETTYVETNISPALLIQGTNVLAVEVHQATPSSSDLSFDLDLWAVVSAPRLRAERDQNCVVLSWAELGFTLEQADNVNGPWQQVPGGPTSPFLTCGSESLRAFYRLRR